MKRYILVLQFSFSSIDDYDAMIQLEDDLVRSLCRLAEVDGHDAGSGEMNIFIFTDDAQQTFEEAGFVVKRSSLFLKAAAFRLVEGEEYTRLWPINSTIPFVVT